MLKIKKDKLLLTPEDIKPSSKKLKVMGVLNPAAARLKDNRIILYIRVLEQLVKTSDARYYYAPRFVGKKEFQIKIDRFPKSKIISSDKLTVEFKHNVKRLNFISHLRKVYLDKSGLKILKIEQKPSFFGLKDDAELGVEDPRITKIGDNYYMTYVGLSRNESISTYLAKSKDCIKWERLGIIFGQQDKDVVLFPEKIKDKYTALDRPEGNFKFSTPHIWIAKSKNLIHWGEQKTLNLSSADIKFSRIGSGPPPIKTEKGWLLIFHGVTDISPKNFWTPIKKIFGIKEQKIFDAYAIWAALLNKNNPEKIIAKAKHPIIIPRKKYETSFENKKVVFPTGIIPEKKYILLYNGAGDKFITVKKIKLKEIMKSLK